MSLLLFLLACSRVYAFDDDSAKRFEALKREFEAAQSEWWDQLDKAGDPDGAVPSEVTDKDPTRSFVPRFRAFAEEQAGRPAAIPALVWLVDHGGRGDDGEACAVRK